MTCAEAAQALCGEYGGRRDVAARVARRSVKTKSEYHAVAAFDANHVRSPIPPGYKRYARALPVAPICSFRTFTRIILHRPLRLLRRRKQRGGDDDGAFVCQIRSHAADMRMPFFLRVV